MPTRPSCWTRTIRRRCRSRTDPMAPWGIPRVTVDVTARPVGRAGGSRKPVPVLGRLARRRSEPVGRHGRRSVSGTTSGPPAGDRPQAQLVLGRRASATRPTALPGSVDQSEAEVGRRSPPGTGRPGASMAGPAAMGRRPSSMWLSQPTARSRVTARVPSAVTSASGSPGAATRRPSAATHPWWGKVRGAGCHQPVSYRAGRGERSSSVEGGGRLDGRRRSPEGKRRRSRWSRAGLSTAHVQVDRGRHPGRHPGRDGDRECRRRRPAPGRAVGSSGPGPAKAG